MWLPDGQVPAADGHEMATRVVVADHVLVHVAATIHLATNQTNPLKLRLNHNNPKLFKQEVLK